MKLGQTSVIFFLSKILASALGFAATIYIAQLLGAGVLGIYSIAIAVVSWLGLVGNMGITSGMKKRVSEQEEPAEYAIAGAAITVVLFVFLSVVIFLFQDVINDYVGFPASGYIVGMLAVSLGYNVISALLNGQHMVHLAGVFSPIKTGCRAGFQIAVLYLGYELAGLFGGYIVGYLVVIVLGAVIVVRSFETISTPQKYHYRNILSFAKFSWLGNLRAKAFNWVDIVVLGFFVPSAFVGYYTAAWNIAQFLIIFGISVSQTLFPEISEIATKKTAAEVSGLINTALSYAGLFLIPGLVGGAILGERILRVYGQDFTQARLVLVILIVATLIQGYQKQVTTILNAIDRPDLAFRVNVVFIAANLILNVLLIYFFGWIGAAVATAGSVAFSLVIGYLYLRSIVEFQIPVKEIARQVFASATMGLCIWGLLLVEQRYVPIHHNFLLVVSLILLGASIYFLVLFGLSPTFRTTVANNIPRDI